MSKQAREEGVGWSSTWWVAHTVGGCRPNPGRGGWGAVLLQSGAVVLELQGFEPQSTNNRMELTAALEALRAVPESAWISMRTDSRYLKNGITKWLAIWGRCGWKTVEGEDVKNQDLWRPLAVMAATRRVVWHWVRARAGDRWNERADELATAARDKGLGTPGIAASTSRPAVSVPCVAIDSTASIELLCAASWSSATRRGGWAVLLCHGTVRKLFGGSVTDTSSNRMHLQAALEGLGASRPALPVRVHCSNGYVVDGITRWLDGWKRRNWCTAEGNDVKNRDQWEALDALVQRLCADGIAIEWSSTADAEDCAELAEAKARASAEAQGDGVR